MPIIKFGYYKSMVMLIIKNWVPKTKPEDYDKMDTKERIRYILSNRNGCEPEDIPDEFITSYLIDIATEMSTKDDLVRIMQMSTERMFDFGEDMRMQWSERGLFRALVNYIRFTKKDKFFLDEVAFQDVEDNTTIQAKFEGL